jgi:hypothetical protein
MADYKESQVSGTQWQRCNAIHIQNTYGQLPSITMQEEQITIVGDQTFQRSVGGLNIAFDPSEEIQLLNPADGSPLGASMTQAQIHVAIWSLYMAKAAARDLEQVV